MTDFLNSWAMWLGLGGGLVSIVAAIVLLRLFAPTVLDWINALVQPVLGVIGSALADTTRIAWENFRDGMLYIGKSTKAVFSVLLLCLVVAISVYVPTAKKVEKRTWATAHKHYRLIPKAKPKPAGKSVSETIRNALQRTF